MGSGAQSKATTVSYAVKILAFLIQWLLLIDSKFSIQNHEEIMQMRYG